MLRTACEDNDVKSISDTKWQVDIDLYDYIIKLIMPVFIVCVVQYF